LGKIQLFACLSLYLSAVKDPCPPLNCASGMYSNKADSKNLHDSGFCHQKHFFSYGRPF